MSALIARRHEIVHRADIAQGKLNPTSIDAGTVQTWLRAAEKFFARVSAMDVCRTVFSLLKSRANENRQAPNHVIEPTASD